MEQNKKKSQQKPAQTTAPFEGPYKTKQSAIAGKKGIGYSTVRHLARMGMKKVMTKEDVEQVDELNKSTLASYAKKASKDVAFKRTIATDFDNASKKYRKPDMKTASARLAMDYRQKARKREDNMGKAIDRLAKEEFVDEGKYVPDSVHINPDEKFAKEKAASHNAAVEKAKQMAKQRVNFKSFRTNVQEKTLTPAEKKKREEVAQAIERENPKMPMAMKMAIATKTAKRVAEEVDDEGKMAKGQLMRMVNQASALAQMMEDDKQLDGWVQSKLTMASDYLDSVHDYLMHNKQDVDETDQEDMEEGVHYCAKHVRSNLLGDGVVLEAQHADPDENGNIEWYMVEFRDGIHKVFTEDIEIMLAEYHGNHKKKKR